MNASTDDPTLIDASLRGDAKAWTMLVERYGQHVWSIGRRCGLSEADAEDLVQAVFASLVEQLGRIADRTRLAGWITTTAKREAWRMADRARRERPSEVEVLEQDAWLEEEDLERLERRQAVRTALARVDARCRSLLQELFGSAQIPSYELVASRMGLSENSVGATRRRCLEDVLDELRGLDPGLFA